MTSYVYAYVDQDDTVVYVGLTDDPPTRHSAHRHSTPWWTPDLTFAVVDELDNRESAKVAERDAIHELAPVHNKAHALRALPAGVPMVSLSDLRKALRLTLAEVCGRVAAITDKSLTVGSLSAIERGHRGASAETLRALEVALGLPHQALLVSYEPSHDRRKKDEVAA